MAGTRGSRASLATTKRIATVSIGALALVATGQIFTHGIGSTNGLGRGQALIDIPAFSSLGVSIIASSAHTFSLGSDARFSRMALGV